MLPIAFVNWSTCTQLCDIEKRGTFIVGARRRWGPRTCALKLLLWVPWLEGYWHPSIQGTTWALATDVGEAGPHPKSTRRNFSSNSKINMSCPKHGGLEEEIKPHVFFYKQQCGKTTNSGHCNFHLFWANDEPISSIPPKACVQKWWY